MSDHKKDDLPSDEPVEEDAMEEDNDSEEGEHLEVIDLDEILGSKSTLFSTIRVDFFLSLFWIPHYR